jgi:hypothetical protein
MINASALDTWRGRYCLPAAHTLCSLAVSWPQGPLSREGFMLRSFHLSLVSLIIFVFLPFFATAQQTSFAVGTASAAPSLSVVISQPRVL